MKKNLLKTITLASLLLLANSAFAASLTTGEKPTDLQDKTGAVFCPMDVKKCEDGSYVSRTGPDCQFTACPKEDTLSERVICAMDAKKCEDGSYVSRKGPKCEFAKCPAIEKINKPKLPKKKPSDVKFCTREYLPVCAAVDTGIRCIKAPCPSLVEKTFSNNCMAKNAGAKFLHDGSCDSPEDSFEGVPSGSSEGSDITDNEFVKKQKEINPETQRFKEEKATLLTKLQNAKNETERKQILVDDKKIKIAASSVVALESTTKTQLVKNKISEKREKVLEKKSDEIFTKFDFFISKIDKVTKKIALKNEIVKSSEVTEVLEQSKISLAEANRLKAEAWIVFSEIAEAGTKEAAKEKILTVKKLLKEAKRNISLSFVGVKQALGLLKK